LAASAALASGIAAADKAGERAVSKAVRLSPSFEEADAADEDALADVESSAPQPPSAKVASATNMKTRRRFSLLMSASCFVKADAVSNPFKK